MAADHLPGALRGMLLASLLLAAASGARVAAERLAALSTTPPRTTTTSTSTSTTRAPSEQLAGRRLPAYFNFNLFKRFYGKHYPPGQANEAHRRIYLQRALRVFEQRAHWRARRTGTLASLGERSDLVSASTTTCFPPHQSSSTTPNTNRPLATPSKSPGRDTTTSGARRAPSWPPLRTGRRRRWGAPARRVSIVAARSRFTSASSACWRPPEVAARTVRPTRS